MLNPQYTYEGIVLASERVAWKLDHLFPLDMKLSFTKPHLPEALARVREIGCLNDAERLALNHIRGNSYMNLFAFVEEYIIALTVRHAEAEMFGDHSAVRALLRFGEEEVKHQQLFKRYCSAFRRDFGSPAQVLDSAAEVAGVILEHSAMAVLLTTLHLEVMTQQHYVDSVKDDQTLDPLFSRILKYHWVEEAQHAKIDVLELAKLAKEASQEEILSAIEQYFKILEAFDGLLAQQVEMDLASLAAAANRTFSDAEAREIRTLQVASYRRDFLLIGMENRLFLDVFGKLAPSAAERLIEEVAKYEERH